MGGRAIGGSRDAPIRLPFTRMLGDMIRLAGIPVAEADARGLVATLLADDHPDGLEAAARITHALDVDAALIALTVEQRDAILAAHDDVYTTGLAELRGALARDLLERKTRPT